MENRVFRNHWSVILRNLLVFGFVLVLFAVGFVGSDSLVLGIVFLVLVALFLYLIHWWYRTTYTFTDTEILIEVDTLFKQQNHIPYAKLASVGVNRTLFNHIFGTSILTFNVNSSMNANVAEGTLCLKKELADRLRDELNAAIFQKEMTVSEDTVQGSLVRVSNLDIVVHSILGQSTLQMLFALVMLGYSVLSVFAESAGGFLVSFLMFALSEVIPVVQVIMKYYNYRIYRVGDTITVQSGMISNYRSSFKVNKVNSVRFSQPFFARLFGKAMLVGEIVGLAGEDGVPLLCPLKPADEVRDLMGRLIPEFACEGDAVAQPGSAAVPMTLTAAVMSVLTVLCLSGTYVVLSGHIGPEYDAGRLSLSVVLATLAVLIPVLLAGRVFLAQGHRAFAMGERTCMILHGSYDLSEEYINYDKVQYSDVSAGPLQRFFGLGTCRVYMMSSMGSTSVVSGLFPTEELEKVGSRVMSRIEDGSYDYRDYY